MIFQFAPWALAVGLSALVPIGFAVPAWARRHSPGGPAFFFLMVALAWWQITAALEMLFVPYALKVLCSQLEYFAITAVPTLFFLFCFDYGEFALRISRRGRAMFAIIPVVSLALVFTNPLHQLVWPTITHSLDTRLTVLIYGHGPVLWFLMGYSYTLLFGASIILFGIMARAQKQVRRQTVWIVIGALVPWAGNLVYMLGLGPAGVELTPVAFILAGIFLYKIMVRHRLLNITPLAYGNVFDYMADAVIVFDNDSRVVETNPAAGRLFSLSLEKAGEPLADIFQRWPEYRDRVMELIPRSGPRSMQSRRGGEWLETRMYNIYDRSGQVKGQYLLVRDITEAKRTEEEKATAQERVSLQRKTLLQFSFSRAAAEGDFSAAVHEITEGASKTLGVERVSVWLGNTREGCIRCLDLYEKSKNAHSSGPVLLANHYPRYFEALTRDRMIDAEDARTDPRTREFTDSYLRPLGITSLLDAPIRVSGDVVGIVCCEHVGQPRPWLADEIRFGSELADATANAYVNAARRKMEEACRESEERFRLLVEGAPDAIFVATEGAFAYLNPAAVALFGAKSADELLGHPIFDRVVPENREHARERLARIQPDSIGAPRMETALLRLDGTSVSVETSVVPISYRDLDGALVFVRDISERKEAEHALRSSLDEKGVLLREIQSRVRNNLQFVSSLLNHQAGAFSDPALRAAFLASRDRVKAIGLVHEKMHRSGNLARIDFSEYLQTLVVHLFQLYQIDPGRIRYELKLDPSPLDINVSIPLGLIVNELVLNSLQHAFPDGRGGAVIVRLSKSGHHSHTLEVRDDGVGIKGNVDLATAQTLGFQLVDMLVDQIGGVAASETQSGTAFTITFPDKAKEDAFD